MAERHFLQLLKKRWQAGSLLCVGLDPDLSKLPPSLTKTRPPAEAVLAFNKAVIDATHDFVCAYKPQSSFYEALGAQGLTTLRETVQYIHQVAPDVPVILDAKRADIGSTNEGYIDSLFTYLDMDAVTLQPYLGSEALQPFLALKNKGLIILGRTSNPGAGELQDLEINLPTDQVQTNWPKPLKLYHYVALQVAHHWNRNGNCLLVVGATYPKEMAEIRQLVGDLPFLVPGIGAQGGDLAATIKAGLDSNGEGMIINSARGIIFASSGEDFAEAAGREAKQLRDQINQERGR